MVLVRNITPGSGDSYPAVAHFHWLTGRPTSAISSPEILAKEAPGSMAVVTATAWHGYGEGGSASVSEWSSLCGESTLEGSLPCDQATPHLKPREANTARWRKRWHHLVLASTTPAA
jgi:hypothetical protein